LSLNDEGKWQIDMDLGPLPPMGVREMQALWCFGSPTYKRKRKGSYGSTHGYHERCVKFGIYPPKPTYNRYTYGIRRRR